MADGIATLPTYQPERTLGYHVAGWAVEHLIQPDGPRAGEAWMPVRSQLDFLALWYEIDEEGRFIHRAGVRRLPKGAGKSPFAAVMALCELCGPVRFNGWQTSEHGGFVGKPVDMPLVQIAATAESQTANTMRMVRAMAPKGSKLVAKYKIDVGKTVFYTPKGQLQIITSSAHSAEGAVPTFVIKDETEHWTPATGGPELSATLDRNLQKTGSRSIETANAWEPGVGSVAETTFDAWQAEQEGRTRGMTRILYDARVAAADTDLTDEASVTAGLIFAYGDTRTDVGGWADIRTLREGVWDARTTADAARRFYLNQPTASVDAWVTPMEWQALTAELAEGVAGPVRRIQDGEDVVLFFDGSKSSDATGLVGCAMSDGHVFTVGGWEPDGEEVPVIEVDACVARAFARWSVVAFFADVREWESFTKISWPEQYGDDLLIHSAPGSKEPQAIAWDMRSRTFDFTAATELAHTELIEKTFTHDGDPMLARHVQNARRRPNRWGVSVGKESKDSSKKIDLAVCMIGARMVRRLVLASDAWKKRRGPSGPNTIILL